MSQPPALPPMRIKPRKGWFVFFCVVFAAWVALLLLLYFSSVYPLRHPAVTP
jgi:hypothetical protein